MLELCKPLHPIVFNDLFCLRNKNVHTLSVGIAQESDFDLHLEAVSLLSETEHYVPQIVNRLREESINALGLEWYQNWNRNLPSWEYTPGNINIPILLWLSNLIDWLDMKDLQELDINCLVMEVIGSQDLTLIYSMWMFLKANY